jgi:GMP synthase (glutamine-hydrolysing)
MRALVVVHSEVPGRGERTVGSVGPALEELGFDVTVGSFVDGPPIAPAGEFAAVVVLGSASSVNDDLPWIAAELAYLSSAVEAGTPVLGICFGGQALARVLGGSVVEAPSAERGFVALSSDDPELLPDGEWLEFHGDAITLPPQARELARNDVCLQAYVQGPHLGVQFHPEITPGVFRAWGEGRSDAERAAVGQKIDVAALVAAIDERAQAQEQACAELVARFWKNAQAFRAA